MSMDRKSRDWPGGPTPPAPRPHERLGGKYPPHEVGDHYGVVRQEILAQIGAPGPVSGYYVSLWMSVPDARLMAVLSIVFEPDVLDGLGALSTQTIHLMSTEDCGRDPVPVEDLIGTAAMPAPLISPGLRGFQYSPTEEVEGMRADLYLDGPYSVEGNSGTGKWVAKARWQALEPMTEIEWVDAVAKMVLLVRPAGIKVLGPNVPG